MYRHRDALNVLHAIFIAYIFFKQYYYIRHLSCLDHILLFKLD